MPLHLDPSVALALGPVGLGFLVALAYFGLIRRHLAVPLVPEVVPVAAEPSGGG